MVAGRGREGEDRRKAFIEAARNGDLPVLGKLLEAGVDIDARGGNGQTALHGAVLGGRREAEQMPGPRGLRRRMMAVARPGVELQGVSAWSMGFVADWTVVRPVGDRNIPANPDQHIPRANRGRSGTAPLAGP